jgi:hypothetical protein
MFFSNVLAKGNFDKIYAANRPGSKVYVPETKYLLQVRRFARTDGFSVSGIL